MAEEITKGITIRRLISLGYPQAQDTKENGIIWYKEDSYNKYDKYLAEAFSCASKSLSGKTKGTPDFTIRCDSEDLIVVIECKEDISNHQTVDNLDDYKNGLGGKEDIKRYCINGALHYASYINKNNDVIALAISGTDENNMRVTSFVLPKGGSICDIKLLEDGDIFNTVMPIFAYVKIVNEKLGRHQEESKQIFDELSAYAISCAKFLRANGISAKDRAGFISAIVLALTNEDSALYTLVKSSLERNPFVDLVNKDAIKQLKNSLEDIWDNKDKIPKVKRDSLKEYYDKLLTKSLLNPPEGMNNKYFKYGNNVLTACLFSIYTNIVVLLKPHTDLDIMGTFYTVFLKYASGDAKDKGIVLTPKHITDLFCDIAEHFLGQKLDDTTIVLDICCGTGAFLISALNKMDSNINSMLISDVEKTNKKEAARRHCLIGVDSEPEMFALAYANMRFHGDGKSNLYSCSSLIKDSATKKGIAGKHPITNENICLADELKHETFYNEHSNQYEIRDRQIDVGMINPPYSLSSSKSDADKSKKQSGQSELDFIYSMLSYLKKGGIGIAIVPVSCASNKGEKMRKNILKEHTLLACMSMPKQLFQNSKVGTTTCIMVFRAHIPHSESDKVVFLSRWQDDGFVTVPHSGRYDKNGDWLAIKSKWLREIKGLAKSDDTIYMRKEIDLSDECLAEAYITTDYSLLNQDNFVRELKKYNLFLYQKTNRDSFLEDKDLVLWLLDNYESFAEKHKKPFSNDNVGELNISKWKPFYLGDKTRFTIKHGDSAYIKNIPEGEIPYISTTGANNGVSVYKDIQNRDGNLISLAYDGSVGEAFYQEEPFFASEKTVTIDIVGKDMNKYIAFFLFAVLRMEKFRYDYGRKWTVDKQMKDTQIKLPVDAHGNPDYDFMERYIKSLPYSANI